ncbi:MAG: hypothetical protein K2G23_02500, partial [Muribaculaceae bacterium]|nr:hypothetical protein [Muribaculaceae bacterium]
MKRKLFTQIRNEWTDNVWMIMELAIVTGAIWIILVLCWETARAKFIPAGTDIRDTYAVSIRHINSESSEYEKPIDSETYDYIGARNILLNNIRKSPLVEAAGLSENGFPYVMGAYRTVFAVYGSNDSILYNANRRMMSPSLARTFRLHSFTGKTPEELERMLKEGKVLISDNIAYEHAGRNAEDMLGKKIISPYDSTHVYEVGDVIAHIRRMEYEYPFDGTVVVPFMEDSVWSEDMAIRVKPGKGPEFVEAFKANPDLRHYGNVYLTDIRSFKDIRENIQHEYDTQLTSKLILIFFLLVVIFLGLLGTFWFRMQQRVGEVAIRMVWGATRRDIFKRVISEGLILFLFGFLLISAALWPFYKKFNTPLNWDTILICQLVAGALVGAGVVVSLLWPARRIMK